MSFRPLMAATMEACPSGAADSAGCMFGIGFGEMLMIGVIAVALRRRLFLLLLSLLGLFLHRLGKCLAQNASRLERDLTSCRYVYPLTGLRVASACFCIRMLYGKGAEPARLDTVPFHDRFGEGLEECIDRCACFCLRVTKLRGDRFY